MGKKRWGLLVDWKKWLLLMLGIGLSRLGDFIYLVAINVLVLQLTGSPAAVAGLWIMVPLASIVTKFWAGTLIDRLNQRNIMIGAAVARALIIAVIPLTSSVLVIYLLLFCLSIAGSFFEPASTTYTTRMIPKENRKKYNSYLSLVTSSAFIIGPAIAGALLVITNAAATMWLTSATFILSALLMQFLPRYQLPQAAVFTLDTFKNDWKEVLHFSKNYPYFIVIFLMNSLIMVLAIGMDAQEVVFIQNVLGLSVKDYGLLTSIAGIGSIVGAFILSAFSRSLSQRLLIGIGFLCISVGYLIYAFSYSFWSCAVGFIIIGLFNTFSNAGILTFFQNNAPIHMIGRLSSAIGTLQSLLQIAFILVIGFSGELFPLRQIIIFFSFFTFMISLTLVFLVMKPSQKQLFLDS
ncbi:MFS transporter [Bacillus tuaregi]|uniref:MFS transporter n=1 Tax=Bacillus tuaregi TaxID=1816695 RepID=UPI0008F896CA|nr:MFS transporter [Bacillus tuaregi]